MPTTRFSHRSSHRSAGRQVSVVEKFESRVLMAIDVAIGTGAPARSAVFTDADGTIAQIRVAGGAATITFDGPVVSQSTSGGVTTVTGTGVTMTNLVVSGTNPGVNITTRGGDGRVTLGGMSAAGPVNAVSGRGVVLGGVTTLSNGIGRLDLAGAQGATITINRGAEARFQDASLSLGDVVDTSITSQQPFRQMRVASWAAGSAAVDQVTTPRINTIQSAGDFAANVALSGNGQVVGRPVLSNARIGGGLTGGAWNVAAKTGSVSAGSVGAGWSGTFTDVANFRVLGDLAGDVTANTINSLSAASMTGAEVRSTQPFAATATGLNRINVRGAISNANIRADSNIGTVTAGSITGSRIYAGVTNQGGQGGRALPADTTRFASASTIRGVGVRGRGTFADTNIAAATLGRMSLGAVNVLNGGTPFGLAALEVRSVNALGLNGNPIRGARLTEPTQSIKDGDFEVRVF